MNLKPARLKMHVDRLVRSLDTSKHSCKNRISVRMYPVKKPNSSL